MECGRKLDAYIPMGNPDARDSIGYIGRHILHIGIALRSILGLSNDARNKAVNTPHDVLQRLPKSSRVRAREVILGDSGGRVRSVGTEGQET